MSERQISIIGLWDVLLVPLQGDVSDEHAEQLIEEVLERAIDGTEHEDPLAPVFTEGRRVPTS